MSSIVRTIFVIIACSMLILIPWPIGGDFPFVRSVVGGGAALSLLLAFVFQFRARAPQKLSISWLFLAIGIGWAIFQVLPGSGSVSEPSVSEPSSTAQVSGTSINQASLITLESPILDSTVSDQEVDSNQEVDGNPFETGAQPLSRYPAASRERLAELAFLVSILIATSCLVTTRRAVRSVMVAAAVAGISVAFVGIVQKLIWNGKLLWIYEYTIGGSPFASFVNRNNAGGF
jgi:hypothetical protein